MIVKEIIENYKKLNNQKIEINGWVKFNRTYKVLGFLILQDGSDFEKIQIVYKEEKFKNFKQLTKLPNGTCINVQGKLVLTSNGKQKFEIIASKINILNFSHENYPLQNKEHSYEFLRDIAYLRPRTNYFYAIFKIRSLVSIYIHEFFSKKNFIWLHSPIITANDAEGAGEAFVVTTIENNDYKNDFFGRKAYLTVSGQLNAEAFAQAFKNVYTFGPTFRAENSNTTKHASEFWMIEPEMAFATMEDGQQNVEELIKYVAQKILKNAKQELDFLSNVNKIDLIRRLKSIIDVKFKTITYEKAINILVKNKDNFENRDIKFGLDLNTEHEKFLCTNFYKGPLFITNYPKQIKAFYMLENNDKKTVQGFDLLVPGIGELVGGSAREIDVNKLKKRAKEFKLEEKELQWYFNLRKFGMSSSVGYGLGLERLVMYFSGVENIRDVIPFPRTPKNLKF